MSKSNWAALAAIAILIMLGFVVVRAINVGAGGSAYAPPQRQLAPIDLGVAAVSARNDAVDEPTPSSGVALVDLTHDNALYVEELNTLFSKLVNRGFTYELVTAPPPDPNAPPISETGSDSPSALVDRLKYASALVLPLPRAAYSSDEQTAIKRFVENGGRVLLIGDPTRTIEVDALNSVSGLFGMIYANDYLYNLTDAGMDNNYRNVVYSNFADSPLTAGLTDNGKVVFYSGGSVSAPGHEIILGDANTHSSRDESGRTVAAAALSGNDNVLTLTDLTFFSEPYNAAESNGQLINNIADFLTTGQRAFDLTDFPYFFNKTVEMVFHNTLVFNSQFEDSAKIKTLLESGNRTVNYADAISGNTDAIFVGRFEDAKVVQKYLDAAGIEIIDQPKPDAETELLQVSAEADEADSLGVTDEESAAPPATDSDFVSGRIQVAGVGQLERGGSTLFLLNQQDGRNTLIILSDNPDTNTAAFDLLQQGGLSDCLVSPTVAVCQTEDPAGKLSPSLRKTRINKILVVSDDAGRERPDPQTGAVDFENVLSDTYKITVWDTLASGSPDLAELQQYDAVIWATGNYWDDSLNTASAEAITRYIEAGGNLMVSGASVAFDWDHTDFLEKVIHADYLTFAEQLDLQTTMADHPIARGFDAEQVLDLVQPPLLDPLAEPLQPDVVSHTADARVIFSRGPASQQPGAPAIIAFEDERSKVAYFAFPVYLLPDEAKTTLLKNTIDWFTRKPLELPNEEDYLPYTLDGGTGESVEPLPDEETIDTGENPADNPDNGDNPEDNPDDNQDNGDNPEAPGDNGSGG